MELVLCSRNKNKIIEIQKLLPSEIKTLSLSEIGCFEELEETANTIEGNAILKANYITSRYGYNCFADDSGLEVEALNGAPGVFSARYSGDHDDHANIVKLLEELKDKTSRRAHFKTVIALNINKEQYLFTGTVKGRITTEKKGNHGFGYDTVFLPDGFSKTFSEITLEEKNKISHRSKAIALMIEFLKTNPTAFEL